MIVELGFPMVDLLWMHAKYHTFDRKPSAGPNTSNSVELEEWLNKSARYYNRTEMLADVGVKSQLRGHKSGVGRIHSSAISGDISSTFTVFGGVNSHRPPRIAPKQTRAWVARTRETKNGSFLY